MLRGADVTSRYKITRALGIKKASWVAFVLEAIYEKGGAFNYPKVFQRDNGSEFKSDETKLLEKHIVDIRKTTKKYKHPHTPFVQAFSKELTKTIV